MRITDHRYTGEIDRFRLAIRMISHEARTGTIRCFTGLSEDRIRKLYGTYFKFDETRQIKRRRGKSPTQISGFINSTARQFESTVLVCMFILCRAAEHNAEGLAARATGIDEVQLGERVCAAFEIYQLLHPQPQYSFERAWGLFHALTAVQEICLSHCEHCDGSYIQDRYALNYHVCPCCELKDEALQADNNTARRGGH